MYCYYLSSCTVAGTDGAASSYHVKQLEEQSSRLKEALVRSVQKNVFRFKYKLKSKWLLTKAMVITDETVENVKDV